MLRSRTLALAILVSLSTAANLGCMRTLEDEYRDAIPQASELSVDVPGSGETATAALVGERAFFYQVTRDTSRAVNGGLWITLVAIHTIVGYRPTEVDETHAVWGPWNDTLNPITYVFAVEKVEEGHYRYMLSGKRRADGDDAYVDLLGGETVIDDALGARRGTIGMDFDAAHALDAYEHRAQGRIAASWDIGADPRVVEAAFDTFSDRAGDGPISALYRYREASDGSGSFEFAFRADLDDEGGAAEDVVLMTRWDRAGAGRGDGVVTGGDAGGAVIYASECWDKYFDRTFWFDNAALQPNDGDAAACPFGEALWSEM